VVVVMASASGSRFKRWWNVEALPLHTAAPFMSISTGYYAKNRAKRMFRPYASFAEKHPFMAAIVISGVAAAIFVALGDGPPSLTF
jgi:hypothetical protein